jgi:pectate lyase
LKKSEAEIQNTPNMKTKLAPWLAAISACLTLNTATAVTLPYHEPFNYSEGNLIAVSGGNWILGNGSSTLEIAVSNSAALSSPSGFPAAAAKGVRRAPSGSARRAAIQYTSVPNTDSNTVFVSFLLNIQNAPGGTELIGYLDNNSTSQGSPQCGIFVDSSSRVGIGKKSSSPAFTSGSGLAAGTHLIVARYTFLASGNDRVDLWVDPSSSDYGASTAPSPLGGATGASDPASLDYFQISTSSGAGSVMFIDEMRFGTTWASVVPVGGPAIGEKLTFTTQPANTAPAATMPPVVVRIQNSGGANADSNGVPVTLTMTSGSGTLSGTLTQNTDANGTATFNDLSIDDVGIKQLTATATGIGAGLADALSSTFSIIAAPVGVKLAFANQPIDGVVNVTMSGVTVQIQDTNSLPIASNAVPITLTLTGGTGTLLGTVTRNTDNTGKAVFNDLSIDTDGAGKELTASASAGIGAGLADAVSVAFNIFATPQGAKLAFTTQPASTPVGATMNDIVVQIQDNVSAPVASNGVPVTLTLTLGSGTVSGTTTQNTDGTGKATFSGLSLDATGAAKQFTASASGIGAGLASSPSSIFAITGVTTTGPTVITQAVRTVSSMILRGTNGAPSGQYQVLRATNPAQPMATWASIQTNTFNANGTFNSTNTVAPGTAQGYFRLLSAAGGGDAPDFGHYGFAGVDASGNPYNLTGGTNGFFPQTNIVLATNFATLGAALSNPAPLIIHVEGEIHMRTNGNFYVQANKTILGIGTNATLVGCLGLYGNASGGFTYACSNIIIRNISIRNPDQYGEDDAIVMKHGAHHIWIDHCTFYDVYDGMVDATRESDFITVSWCKFFYNFVNSHGDTVSLIGGNDGDSGDLGKLHITYHHNWFGSLARERMPSVRFGRAHVFNNYFNAVDNHYCVRARLYSEVLVENNYFDNVFNPWELATSSQGPNGKLRATGNITNNCTFATGHYDPNLPNMGVVVLVPGSDTLSSGINQLNPPPYAYTPDSAINVPATVQAHAGAGKGPFAP